MTDDLVLRVAALKVVSEFTKKAYDESRRQIAPTMERGDRKMCRSPLSSVKLGAVTLSDPKPVALVTDEQKLREWAAEHYPEAVESAYEVIGSDREVADVLFEHAPHLLRKVAKLRPDWLREVRAESAAIGIPVGPGGEADIPGIEVKEGDPVVSCKPTEEALAAIVELFRVRRLSLEGLTELPGGDA